MRDFDRAVRGMSDKAFAWVARGRVNYLLGNHWSAAQDLNEAIRIYPEYAAAFDYLARVRCKQDRPEDAVQAWQRMLRIDRDLVARERKWLRDRGFLGAGAEESLAAAQLAYAEAGCPGR